MKHVLGKRVKNLPDIISETKTSNVIHIIYKYELNTTCGIFFLNTFIMVRGKRRHPCLQNLGYKLAITPSHWTFPYKSIWGL